MLNVWKSVVVPRWAIRESTWYRRNHIYGWAVPITLVSLLLAAQISNHAVLDPKIGVHSCWFQSSTHMWLYMYVPMAIMLAINTVLFVWTCIVLHLKGGDLHPDRKRALQYK